MSYRSRPAAKLPLAAGCAMAALFTTPLAFSQTQSTAVSVPTHRVVIDSVTGRPRAPEAGEWIEAPAASERSAAKTAAPAAAGVESHAAMQRHQAAPVTARMGGVVRRVDLNKLSYSVAHRDASGIVVTEVRGEEAASKAASKAADDQVKGERNDQ
jgi:hypothetical protein